MHGSSVISSMPTPWEEEEEDEEEDEEAADVGWGGVHVSKARLSRKIM